MKRISRTLIAASAATVFAVSMAAAPAAASGHDHGPQGKQLGKLAQQCAYERGYDSLGDAFGSRPHASMRGGVPGYLAAHCGYGYGYNG